MLDNIYSVFLPVHWLTLFAPGAAICAILYGIISIKWINGQPACTEQMQAIAAAIQEGAQAYLSRQYKIIALMGIILFAIIAFSLNWETAGGFVIGSTFSAVAGFIGMHVSVRANARTAQAAAYTGIDRAFLIAIRGGSITGMLVAGLGLLAVSGYYETLLASGVHEPLQAMIGVAFGASLIAVFARLGGGIFTKGADVGADLVGKLETGIPEDDPRNPAVIADQVGDNVGDCAGMGADLFESYTASIIGTMILADLLVTGSNNIHLYPLVLVGISILTSIVGIFCIRIGSNGNIIGALYSGLIVTAVLTVLIYYPVTQWLLGETLIIGGKTVPSLNLFYSAITGLGLMAALMPVTVYYTSSDYAPVRYIAKASTTGHGTNVIAGLSVSMKATAAPIILICASMWLSYQFAGLFGIAMASVGMMSLTGLIVAMDAYGPITDNAGGIAEMAKLPEEIRKMTDALDAVGNTTKAVTKGSDLGCAGLAALVLFSDYTTELGGLVCDLGDIRVILGLLLGALIPYLCSALAMEAVGKAAGDIVNEVRRQFKEIPGIMDYTAKPDYSRAVDILTISALRKMLVPALLPVCIPVIAGFTLGKEALGGVLIGSIISGLCLAISMSVGGGAFDNAKKFIEAGHHGGKGSLAHKASITGDTVGDPYKDTAGPAVNIIMKIVNIIALLIAPLL